MRIENIRTKALLTAALILCFFCTNRPASAQTIANGSHWFDGSYYYTATVSDGAVSFESFNYQGDGPCFNLRKVADEAGAYIFTMKNDAEPLAMLRTEIGAKARYIRNSGMNFLAIYDKDGDLAWTLNLTPDSMENCYAAEEWAEQQPVDEMLDSFLMNTRYLGKIPKETLELMLDELKAVCGKNPGIIASTNMALIQAELGVAESDRVGNEVKEIVVHNEEEFLKALGSYRKVVLADGVHLNLSRAIENEARCNEAGILMIDAYASLEGREGLFSESVSDGRQLVLKGFHKLTIQGGKDCEILVSPRYSYIFRFVDCEEIILDNLTLGHTQGGYCEGGVLGLESCTYVDIYRCDLYGCGTYGIDATDCTSIYMAASIIRDCSYGIMVLRGVREFNAENCDFYRNREFDLISANGSCTGIMFYNCRFSKNQGILFDLDIDIRLEDCEVHHDLTRLGSMSEVSDAGTTWDGKSIDLPARQIGPDSGAEVY